MVSSKEEAHHIMGPDKRVTQLAYYLTGQVVAAYIPVRLTPQNFGRLASGHF